MTSPRYICAFLGLPLFFALLFVAEGAATGDDWKPIDPVELSLKTSVVEKDADAEALFWEVKVDDNPEGDQRW